MKNLILIFLIIGNIAFAQKNSKLDEMNGFKDIKLNSPISDYDGFKLNPDDFDLFGPEEKSYKYIGDDYQTIGDYKIYDLSVGTYKGRIDAIYITCECNKDLITVILELYGKEDFGFTLDSNEYKNGFFKTWMWDDSTEKVDLTLSYRRFNIFNDPDNPNVVVLKYESQIIRELREKIKNEKRRKKMNKAYDDF